jgi:Protein of unknown function (DUF1553)/Protein of unknown function (DUF1549)/Planctomycete cytochrome C
MRVSSFLVIGVYLAGLIHSAGAHAGAPKTRVTEQVVPSEHAEFFEAKIRPILEEHCYKCHGARKQESGLRLDSRERILRGSDTGPVVVPGHPDESPLIEAIGHDGATKMPPKSKLPPPAITDLTRWVKMGIPWPDHLNATGQGPVEGRAALGAKQHWAFQPICNPAPPEVKAKAWTRTPVDPFILAKLETAGLSPSPQADRRTLIRRASFDLTGLPPTPEEVDAFAADITPDSFERLVERLLASPRYGERWGRFWLDVARYADTKGYILFQDANYHWAYTYRDYVIRAFNQDLPYDRFLIEQIAADRLPEKDGRKPLAALGFLTLGGRFMGNVHDVIDDRIDVICRGLMSLTVTCARCHDHKFDPIPAQDYYSLYGVLASAREPEVPPVAAQPEPTAAYTRFVKELEARQRKLSEFVAGKHREMVESSKRRAAEYLLAAQKSLDQPSTEDFMLLADGDDLNPTMLVRWQVYLARMRRTHDPVFALWHALATLPERDFAQDAGRVIRQYGAASESAGTNAVRPVNPVVLRALSARLPGSLREVAHEYGRLLTGVEELWQERVCRATLEERVPQPLPDPDLESLRQVFYGPDSPPNVVMLPYGDLGLLPDRPSQAKLQELRNAVQNWLTTGLGAPARAMSLEDSPTPFDPRVFLRGNPNNLGEPVPRRFLALLSGSKREPFRDGGGRLGLAMAVASRENPLTARAIVNRIWMHHFGTPLVATAGDFGLRSEPPTHPELLDHLASRFVDAGWSLKSLHRWIMLSSTYQQRSDDRSVARAHDPENTLYWRANRRRLDFEATRDTLLAVSGCLSGRIGGPPMPSLTGTEPRRTIYGFVDRLNLPGLYRTFDFPDPSTTSPRRDQTTVAPQALFLMNDPFMIYVSRSMLARPEIVLLRDTKRKVEQLFRLIYGRTPSEEEFTAIREYLKEPTSDPRRWQSFVQATMMANEFVFVD